MTMNEPVEYKEELQHAISNGDLDEVRRHFEIRDLDSDEYDGTPLHHAACLGTLEIVKFLVEQGADINRRGGNFDCPAVTYAAFNGNTEIVRYLVELGSVLDTSHALRNPLLMAAEEGHFDIVSYLLNSTNIDPHAAYRNPSGALINALTRAEENRHTKIVELLKSRGCRRPVEGVDKPLWEPRPESVVNQTPELQRAQQITDYVSLRFGLADDEGMQELLPMLEGMSVTIQSIPPSDEHPYLVLFTNGMSDRPMKVPAGQEAWRYAELVMHLPPDWPHPRDAQGDARWLWPIHWLRKAAYLPHLNETWLGSSGTIIPSADPPVPLGPNTKQSCLLLIPDFANLSDPLVLADGKLIHFHTVVPLYTEERDYEAKFGLREFYQRFIQRKVSITVDIHRPSFVD
jgi:hypothetical protein